MAKFLDDLYVTGNNANVLVINSDAVADILLVSNAGAVAVGSDNFVGNVYANPKFIINTGSGIPGLMHLNSFGVELVTYTNVGDSLFGNASNHDLAFITNDVERIKITASGAVGINHLTPPAQLTIVGAGNTSATHALRIGNSSSDVLLDVQDDGKVGINKSTPTATLDVLAGASGNILKLNSVNTQAAFYDALIISNDGSFQSGSGTVGAGLGTFKTDHLTYTMNTAYQTYLAFSNNQGSGNRGGYGIIGASIANADNDYRLVVLNNDASTLGSVLKVVSTANSNSNDGFDYNHYAINIISNGVFTNAGSGTFYKTGLKIDVTNGDINHALWITNGSLRYEDGNQAAGSILAGDADGNASWNTIGSLGIVTGTGTQNVLTKWDPTGAALVDTNISDNGTDITVTTFAGTGDRMVEAASTGIITATRTIINTYGIPNTEKLKLEDPLNWDINGNYTGASTSPATDIVGTYQGQKHYNDNYFYEAVADNFFIRLIRG